MAVLKEVIIEIYSYIISQVLKSIGSEYEDYGPPECDALPCGRRVLHEITS
jgi:hypothetical protein